MEHGFPLLPVLECISLKPVVVGERLRQAIQPSQCLSISGNDARDDPPAVRLAEAFSHPAGHGASASLLDFWRVAMWFLVGSGWHLQAFGEHHAR